MQHSDKLKVRFKILTLKYNISKRQTEELNLGNFDSAYECFEIKRCLEFIVHVFDEVAKIETTNLVEIDKNIKYINKESNNILRTLKLIKLKYKI